MERVEHETKNTWKNRDRKKGQRYLQSMRKRGREREKNAAHAHISEAMSTHEFISAKSETSEESASSSSTTTVLFGCVFCFFFLDEVDVK